MKDYKVDKEKMSDAFCREVYGVIRDVPAGKVISYGEIASYWENRNARVW